MSLRQIAKILGVHHSTLSKCINGQRGWNPELKARYDQLATSLNKSGGTAGGGDIAEVGKFVPVRNGEPGGTRTHDTRIKSPMLYQTELPAHNNIIKALIRDKKMSGFSPRTLEFYHENLKKLCSEKCLRQLRKRDI